MIALTDIVSIMAWITVRIHIVRRVIADLEEIRLSYQ